MTDKISIETVFGTLDDDQQRTISEGIKEISIHLSKISKIQYERDGFLSLSKIQYERDRVKDIVASIHDETKIPKKLINRIARVFHKQIFAEVIVEDNEFQSIYETVVRK